jgi:hypothetical protein
MTIPYRRRLAGWWVAGLTLGCAAGALALLFRPLARVEEIPLPAPPPRVDVARLDAGAGNRLLQEQAMIFDPTPLFMPTPKNAGQRPLPATVLGQRGQVFTDIEAKPVFGGGELTLPVASAELPPGRPADLLRAGQHDPLLGFGREDVAQPALPPRQGLVEVRRVDTGAMVFTGTLDEAVLVPAGQRDWQPAEYLVAVTAAGLLGRPVDTASSEIEAVDAFFRDYLGKTLHLGERLAPGMYRVVVGP